MCMTSLMPWYEKKAKLEVRKQKREKRTCNHPNFVFFANIDSLNFLFVLICPQTFTIVIVDPSINLGLSY